jgi:hypothetical protein
LRVRNIAVRNKDKPFLPASRQRIGVTFGKTQRRANIGLGIQGIQKENPAYDRLNITGRRQTAGHLQLRTSGKRDQMDSVADSQKLFQKGAGQVITGFTVPGAHAGGCIQ